MTKARNAHNTLMRTILDASAGPTAAPASDDAALRELWSRYLQQAAAHAEASDKYDAARAAFDAELPPCPEGVPLWQHREEQEGLSRGLWRRHGLVELSATWNDTGTALNKTVQIILETPATGAFGLGVKLGAIPACGDSSDVELAVAAVQADIDRLLGTSFSVIPEDDKDDSQATGETAGASNDRGPL